MIKRVENGVELETSAGAARIRVGKTTMSVILTRVRLPQRRQDVVSRARLLDILHRGLQRKLTFVSAPAGYGKTTLLVDFAADLDATICWYSISPDHNDLAAFAEHTLAAFQQHFPKFGEGLVRLLQTPGSALEPYSLATDFANELVTQIGDVCILMLDDFHLVGEAPKITDFVETLLEHLPDHVRLVIAGRSYYGIPSVNLHAHGDLAVIGEKELRFRADELQALVKQNYRRLLSNEQAAQLAKVSDGWIVAILLTSGGIQQGNIPKLDGAKEDLYAFLAEEVLLQQPPALQTLLLATSIVDEFDEPLCNHLLETDSCKDLLGELVGRNLFVAQTISQTDSGEASSYQYHHLFSEFLRDRLWKTGPATARALHQRAAEWYAEREAWELAVRHRLAASDHEGAARWMDQVAPSLFVAGHSQLLAKWVEALSQPSDLRSYAPRLLLSHVKTLVDQGKFGALPEQLLDIAENAFHEKGDDEETANTILIRGRILCQQGNFAKALTLTQDAQKLLKTATNHRWYQSKRLEGVCNGYLGNLDQAIAALEVAISGFRDLEQHHDLAEALNDLGLFQFEQGNVMAAQNCWLEALKIRRTLSNHGALAVALNNVGYIFYQVGHYQQAWQAYEEALQAVQSAKIVWLAAAILNGKGDLLRDIEEWQLAENSYASAAKIGEAIADQNNLAYTYTGLTDLERLRGNFSHAFDWLRQAAYCRKDTLDSPTYQAGLGTIYLDMGQIELAQEAFDKVLRVWQDSAKPSQSQTLVEFLMAQAQFEGGQPERCLEMLAQALRHSAQLGYDQFLVVAGRQARPMLAYASKNWNSSPQLRSLIQRIEQFQTGLTSLERVTKVAAEPAQPLRLELFAFGAGRVQRDGAPIPPSAWASRSRALFFYLADRGQASKDEIALDFWPDFSPEKITNNFHATLWRVRRAIGREVLLFEDERYKLSPSVMLWHDVAEFETRIRRVFRNSLSPEEKAEVWREAIALYQGHYLQDISLEWAERRRRELQSNYLLALTQLADWGLSGQYYREARGLYEKAIAVDPVLDEAHAGLMKCLYHIESPAAARAHFLTYRKMLKDEFGYDPPSSLQALYEQMVE